MKAVWTLNTENNYGELKILAEYEEEESILKLVSRGNEDESVNLIFTFVDENELETVPENPKVYATITFEESV